MSALFLERCGASLHHSTNNKMIDHLRGILSDELPFVVKEDITQKGSEVGVGAECCHELGTPRASREDAS